MFEPAKDWLKRVERGLWGGAGDSELFVRYRNDDPPGFQERCRSLYRANRPPLDDLVGAVAIVLRGLEIPLRKRLERVWNGEEGLVSAVLQNSFGGIANRRPPYGGRREEIAIALNHVWPGIDDADIDAALQEAERLGSACRSTCQVGDEKRVTVWRVAQPTSRVDVQANVAAGDGSPDILADGVIVRRQRAKKELHGLMEEAIARFEEAPGDPHVELFGLSHNAALAAAILGFVVPPVEYEVFHRPANHPLLAKHPEFDCVQSLRINDPEGLTFTAIDLGASARATEANANRPPVRLPRTTAVLLASAKRTLRSWNRAVQRLAVEDVVVAPGAMQSQRRSLERWMFDGCRARVRAGLVDESSEATPSEELPEELRNLTEWLQDEGSKMYRQVGTTATDEQPKEAAKGASGKRISMAEANLKAREYLEKCQDAKLRELAQGIECSTGLVCKLPAWKAVQEERRKHRKPKAPRAVALSEKVIAKEKCRDEALDRLLREQEADSEPSPLEDAARPLRTRKRV